MPNPSDLLPPKPSDLWRAILDLRRDLRELAAARRSERTGNLRVYTSAGVLVLETGVLPDTHVDGSAQEGIRIYREDGSLVASVAAQPSVTGTDRQAWTLYDRQGVAIVADDPVAAGGLARPYIPVHFARSWYNDWAGTNSGSFVDIYQTTIKKQQAMCYVILAHTNDVAAATGQVRITANGSVISGSTTSTSFSVTTTTIGPFALPGAQLAAVDLRVQGRMASGTGNVRCEIITASQIQA
ncbi:hypothetical protein [Streptomyces sp. NPDC086989]|uniref:hypothetical protein n=1 Tax=Streptomyces sp. NPDC086989 TaxID=3365764 RepID=UPI003817CDE3